ncbi:MAG: hypothetical protein QOD77_1058 [Thermoplasmata archaeon]|jgi:hypothetical protein|nr:hypothetical protein [Thermoplasmata archaeon]
MLARPLIAAGLLLLGAFVLAPQPATAIYCKEPEPQSVVSEATYQTCQYTVDMVYDTPTVGNKIDRTQAYVCIMVGVC